MKQITNVTVHEWPLPVHVTTLLDLIDLLACSTIIQDHSSQNQNSEFQVHDKVCFIALTMSGIEEFCQTLLHRLK